MWKEESSAKPDLAASDASPLAVGVMHNELCFVRLSHEWSAFGAMVNLMLSFLGLRNLILEFIVTTMNNGAHAKQTAKVKGENHTAVTLNLQMSTSTQSVSTTF